MAYLCYAWATRNEYQGKYLDYRALAEGLRVQFFWKLAGLNKSVADYYLQNQKSELDWIRTAIRAWTVSTESDEHNPAPVVGSQSHVFVLTEWVRAQRRFFAAAVRRDQRKLRSQKLFVRLFFLAAFVLASVQVFQPPNDMILFSMGLALWIAGLLAGYGESRALSQQIKQYAKMGALFAITEQRLEDLLEAEKYAEALVLVEELGKEVLRENGDWVILHRERAVEVPSF